MMPREEICVYVFTYIDTWSEKDINTQMHYKTRSFLKSLWIYCSGIYTFCLFRGNVCSGQEVWYLLSFCHVLILSLAPGWVFLRLFLQSSGIICWTCCCCISMYSNDFITVINYYYFDLSIYLIQYLLIRKLCFRHLFLSSCWMPLLLLSFPGQDIRFILVTSPLHAIDLRAGAVSAFWHGQEISPPGGKKHKWGHIR